MIKESEKLELKTSTSGLKEAIISIVAILNKHQKGRVIFGIKNSGQVIGQKIGKDTLRDISKSISDNIEPKIYPIIKEETVDEKSCIFIDFSGNSIPYYAYGRAYKRIADEDRLMSAKELEKMILEKNKDKLKWDSGICKKAKVEDISKKRLKWFLKESGKEYYSVEKSLDKLGLIRDGKLLNSALILFGKNPRRFFSNIKLRCAVFATTGTSIILDRQEFEGNLFNLIEKAEEYILKNIHIGMRLEGLRRIDVPEINKDAFREAIINAFCHRNYYELDSVNIAIFKDKLEIRNPGGLYGGLTIEQIKKEKVSKRRNEIIANMFHEIHFVEKWGRGIDLILSKEPDTEFKEIADIFIIVFKRKNVPKTTLKTTPKTTLKTDDKILAFIKRNQRITKEELARQLDITIDGVKYHIKKLKKDNIVEWTGSSKGGYWKIIKKLK